MVQPTYSEFERTITKALLDVGHPDAIAGLSAISILTLARDQKVLLTFVDGIAEVVDPTHYELDDTVLCRMNDQELLAYFLAKNLTDDQILTRMGTLRGQES